MRLPTFSGLGDAILCAGTVVLPQVDEASEYKDRGHARHRFLAAAANAGRKSALADAPPEHLGELEALDVEALLEPFRRCGPVRAEVAYAYDPFHGIARELGEDIDRAYESAGADRRVEVCGTLDLFAMVRDAPEAVVVDMKGRAAGDPWQLRVQALALARAHGLERVHVAFAHAQEGGGWRWAAVEVLDAMALDAYEQQIMDAWPTWSRAAEAAVPDVVEGKQCDWCASRRYCPAKTALIRAAGGLSLPQEVALLTAPERAAAWKLVKKYKPLLEQVDKALREAARYEPIDLGDKVVTATPGNEEIDPAVAVEALRDAFGTTFVDAASSTAITKAGIKRACELLGVPLEEALAAIRAAGGVTRGEDKVREVKRPRGQLPEGSQR